MHRARMPIQQQRHPSFERCSPSSDVIEDVEYLPMRDEDAVDEVRSYPRKKCLSRTDSSIMIIRPKEDMNEEFSVERLKSKPPPSPPILVENVHGKVQSLNSDRATVLASRSCTVPNFTDGCTSLANYSSCPNLVDKDDASSSKSRIRSSRSSEGRLCKTAPSASQSSRTSHGLLSVPNVFTTSYTHSKPMTRRQENTRTARLNSDQHQDSLPRQQASRKTSLCSSGQDASVKEPWLHRFSAPELFNSGKELPDELIPTKPVLTKSLSDTPHSATIVQCRASEPKISVVGDLLCLGNPEAAHDERLLCRNKVASVLDLSNISPEDVPLKRKNIAPCTCGSATSHMRPVLRLTMCESDLVEVKSHFPRINRFIDGARNNQKRVLIYCDSLNNNLSILVAAQYLMQRKKMNFRQAFSQIMKGCSEAVLNPAYSALLQSVENELFKDDVDDEEILQMEKPKPLLRKMSSSLLPKEAWTDNAFD